MHDDLRSAIRDMFPSLRADLEALVAIPSVSADGFDPSEVRRSAQATADLLRAAGAPNARLLEIDGAHPAVFADIPGPLGAPTVLLYAHHDVQPPGDLDEWRSPPFEATERDGRLYGRGASDDKAGIIVHLAALRAHGGRPPVGVKLLIEGEEEIGSTHITGFLDAYSDLLAADAIVIADAANWRVGQPALTTTLRGLVDCVVEVRTLRSGVHSGLFGGAFPDALTVLARLLASLHDDQGRAALPGLAARDAEPLDLTDAELREQAGVLDSTETIGEGTLTSRLWTQPAISILGIDAPSVDGAINQLVPSARAKLSLRLAPGDDPARALDALTRHLHDHVPWGAEIVVTPGSSAMPVDLDPGGLGYDAFGAAFEEAWGRPAIQIGLGGSIPFVAAFADVYPQASILLTAVGEPRSSIHGPNESQDLQELERACLAEAIALRLLGAQV